MQYPLKAICVKCYLNAYRIPRWVVSKKHAWDWQTLDFVLFGLEWTIWKRVWWFNTKSKLQTRVLRNLAEKFGNNWIHFSKPISHFLKIYLFILQSFAFLWESFLPRERKKNPDQSNLLERSSPPPCKTGCFVALWIEYLIAICECSFF